MLYTTGMTPDGIPLVGGLWTLKTTDGFPLDMAYEECKRIGGCPDWVECLADALSVPLPAFEYDKCVEEMRLLLGESLANSIAEKFMVLCSTFSHGEPVDETAKKILKIKRHEQ